MGYLFRIILKYKNGFLTKKIRFFDKNFERLHLGEVLVSERRECGKGRKKKRNGLKKGNRR